MIERLPYVSGLPGPDLRGPRMVAPASVAFLKSLREWAQTKADEARPRAQHRFDGIERTPADVDAIADVEACDSLVRLLDGVMGDPILAQRAAQLVRGRK